MIKGASLKDAERQEIIESSKLLPELIQSKEFDVNTRNERIGNPILVVNLILADHVSNHTANMEKEAQSKTFGPFDFAKVTAELKEILSHKLKHSNHRARKLLDILVFECERN